MDIKEIKAMIDLMAKNNLSEFELERAGEFKIRIRRGADGQFLVASPTHPALQALPPNAALPQAASPLYATHPAAATSGPGALPGSNSSAASASSSSASGDGASPSNEITIRSPMVGTFYASVSPGTPPYVEMGQQVNEDTVVCIIEAMKVMSEIKAEVKGVVTAVLAENGKPVEFGRPLFRVRPL